MVSPHLFASVMLAKLVCSQYDLNHTDAVARLSPMIMAKSISPEKLMLDWEAIAERQPSLKAIPEKLRKAAKLYSVSAGSTMYHCGERPKGILCVLDGEFRLVRHLPDGADAILQRSRGGFIAEASMDANTYHCDVVVAESGQVLFFPISDFRAALTHDPIFNYAWIVHQASELRRLRAQCERLSLNGAAERILHYLEAEGDEGIVALTQTRKAWASELGLSYEVVYRTLRQLREDGMLDIDGSKIALSQKKLNR